jgi:HEPN domain-containing protein
MNIDYINTLYPDAKTKNPELYIQSLETLIGVLEEKIEMLESCIFNNEKHIAEYKQLFDESMRLLERNRIEMYGDDENDGELIKKFSDGMQQGIQIVKEVINEKTH